MAKKQRDVPKNFLNRGWGAMTLFHQHFVRIAKSHGEKLAFIDRSAGRRVTYTRALTTALILAGKFRTYEEAFLGIMLPTSAGCSLAFIGVLMSGKTPVMINYSTGASMNAKFAQERCGFSRIITSRAFIERVGCQSVEGMIFLEDIIAGISMRDTLRAAVIGKFPAGLINKSIHTGHEDDTIVILFTSGSEEKPKAVQLTHRNVMSNIRSFSSAAEMSGKDRMLANLPFFHVLGLSLNLLTPLYHGMTIVSSANPLYYREICTIAREERVTLMAGTPSFLRGYLRKAGRGDFESLRLVVCGADKCPDALRRDFLERHGITLYEGYGTTETSPVISINMPGHNRPGSVGKALADVQIRIVHCESGEECRPGETGLIMVAGDLIMKGYFDDPEETSMRIRHGWYDTGDMGYIDEDGFLWHAGRLKRFVKIGGEMVSLVKVQTVLEGLLPEDASCCVVEIPDEIKGVKIVAVVTQPLDERRILERMAEQLPNLFLPGQFVVIEELPRTGSGKIDFRAVSHMVGSRLR
jgi:acyl-[acyl-carrier-protein]-phospholipid O-acyltransferase/long-chain-fatty-acid--[acyl-carrier-protein] ligase